MEEKIINILLVEDDEVDVMNVKRAFRKINVGNPLLVAGNGEEALALCRKTMPHVVLLDWRLGDLDGAGFIAALRREAGEAMPRIIFCSSEREITRIIAALDAGADEYIMKPFDADIIGSKLAMTGLIDPSELRRDAVDDGPDG